MMLPLFAIVATAIVVAQNPPGDALEFAIRADLSADVAVIDARLSAFAAVEGRGRGRYSSTTLPDGRLSVRFKFDGPTPSGFVARLKALLATPGRLEIWGCAGGATEWLLDGARDTWKGRPGRYGAVDVDFGGEVPDAARLRAVLKPPKGSTVVVERLDDSEHHIVAAEAPPALTRADVERAELKEEPASYTLMIALHLTAQGKAAFGRLTTRCVKRLMPITFDGRAVMIPVVQEPITGGVAHITLSRASPKGTAEAPSEATSVGAAALVGGELQGRVTLE